MQKQLERQKNEARFYLLTDHAWYELVVQEVTETTVIFLDKSGENTIICPIESVMAIASAPPAHIGRKAR